MSISIEEIRELVKTLIDERFSEINKQIRESREKDKESTENLLKFLREHLRNQSTL